MRTAKGINTVMLMKPAKKTHYLLVGDIFLVHLFHVVCTILSSAVLSLTNGLSVAVRVVASLSLMSLLAASNKDHTIVGKIKGLIWHVFGRRRPVPRWQLDAGWRSGPV